MKRAVLWVVLGAVVLVIALGATAPELLGDLGGASGLALVAFAAGIPGAVVLLVLAATRKGRHDQPGAGRPQPTTTGRAQLTPEDLRRARPSEARGATEATDPPTDDEPPTTDSGRS